MGCLKIVEKSKVKKKDITVEQIECLSCFRIPQNYMDQREHLDICPDNSCFLKTRDTDYDWNPALVKTKGIPRYICLCLDTGNLVALNPSTPVIPVQAELHLL